MINRGRLETVAIHGSQTADACSNSLVFPICQTSAFTFDSAEQAANLFMLEESGDIYSRMGNPTVGQFEEKMTALDNGVGAVATASGMTAISYAIINLCRQGDNFIASPDLYGGVSSLFKNIFSNFGIEARFVDHNDPENFRKACDEKTRLFFGETLPNPRLNIFPIQEIADIAEQVGLPLIIDNTCATPALCRPFEHGAHITVYSATKYICGHGSSIGGIVVDGGRFVFKKHAKRFPLLNEPDASYHGIIWSDKFGEDAYITKLRATILRDLGGCLAPLNAFLFSQGLETLSLRMQQHCKNAALVANFLQKHPQVQRVRYPGLLEGKQKEWADKYLQGNFGGMVGVDIKGGKESAKEFVENLRLFQHVANIGDARSLVIHPASTTHSQISQEVREQGGITDGYVRLCVGIEHIDDILNDLEKALQSTPQHATSRS